MGLKMKNKNNEKHDATKKAENSSVETAETTESENLKSDSAENEKCAECEAGETSSAETEEIDPVEALKKEIETLKAENADLKDQVLRRAADFDNYRKRMIKEKQEAFDFANENLLKDLLDSLDNFDRTVEAAGQATEVGAIASGVQMVNANLVKMLEDKYNLSSYGKAGEPFNPDEHEAIGSVQGEVAEPTLKEVYLKGYKLKDRVIRHAKVMVEMPV